MKLIPDEILIQAASKRQREYKKCVDNFVTYELEQLKADCGPDYAHVALDDVRIQSVNLRKRSKLGSVKGHGPGKITPPQNMIEYYQTDHWKAFAKRVREFWKYRCAVCYSDDPLDVHHRTYARMGHEELTDAIAVCRNCHKACDLRRKRQAAKTQTVDMFE